MIDDDAYHREAAQPIDAQIAAPFNGRWPTAWHVAAGAKPVPIGISRGRGKITRTAPEHGPDHDGHWQHKERGGGGMQRNPTRERSIAHSLHDFHSTALDPEDGIVVTQPSPQRPKAPTSWLQGTRR